MKEPCLLVGDIGGTNARFAHANADVPGYSAEKTFKCRDYPTADLAINAYLQEINASKPAVICIAAAGPIVDGSVRFTNNSWSLETTDLQRAFKGASVWLLNDFEAIAYSIPFLEAEDCLPVGLCPSIKLSNSDFTIGIVGPGTGLGAAGLFCRDGQLFPITGEGGHIGFAPDNQVQMDILMQLRDQHDRVSDERLASGPGIVNIYRALCHIHGESVANIKPAEIFQRASDDGNSTEAEAIQIFFEVLGQVAGNLALTIGASDGVYLGGGIVSRNPDLIANSRFRTGFERKGRHRSLMEKIPTQLILHEHPGLLGASYYALRMLNKNGPGVS